MCLEFLKPSLGITVRTMIKKKNPEQAINTISNNTHTGTFATSQNSVPEMNKF